MNNEYLLKKCMFCLYQAGYGWNFPAFKFSSGIPTYKFLMCIQFSKKLSLPAYLLACINAFKADRSSYAKYIYGCSCE